MLRVDLASCVLSAFVVVIDIFPAESDGIALRVELFDEEVERL